MRLEVCELSVHSWSLTPSSFANDRRLRDATRSSARPIPRVGAGEAPRSVLSREVGPDLPNHPQLPLY